MKKLSRPGDKVAGAGMVSGTSKQCSINNNVTSVRCKYADDNKVNCYQNEYLKKEDFRMFSAFSLLLETTLVRNLVEILMTLA